MHRIADPLRAALSRLSPPARRRAGGNATRSTLLGPSGRNPLAEYDDLPPPLRAWLAQAAMPWSPRSALKIWQRVLRRSGGDVRRAQQEMTRIEAARLAEDVLRVWGPAHPYLSAPETRTGTRSCRSSTAPAIARSRRAGPAGRR
ncbi:hypothetical protein DRV85_09540 [Rhodosalinus halophilus]|uniref:Uncharacterized protein n=1 Tax=Rhodosalinus halophilus TaxID=2259333 RepID=A0A365U9H8_9RHOB|nr:DUF6525 family protein [Rhodosalinus halophilus]RBI84904.1 hypothetical protein DRV85_09540 [Rhodosalinus halophilus]